MLTCLTLLQNVLAAAYPDYFAAGIVYAGVPAGCFVSSSNPNSVAQWNSTCAQGKSIAPPEIWASIVKNMDPGYTGPRPRMLIYHGGNDATLLPQNFKETTKQWCGVFGYDYWKPESIIESEGFTTTRWGPDLMGVFGAKETHQLSYHAEVDMEWFGLLKRPTSLTSSSGYGASLSLSIRNIGATSCTNLIKNSTSLATNSTYFSKTINKGSRISSITSASSTSTAKELSRRRNF
jgi:acetylxylan esterase